MGIISQGLICAINETLRGPYLICTTLCGHAFGTLHVCLNNGNVSILGGQQKGVDSTVIGWVWLNCPLCVCVCVGGGGGGCTIGSVTIGDGLLSII